MIVQGVEITSAQIEAGTAAMVGDFYTTDVAVALNDAGVSQDDFVCGRTADRLLQKARKAGKIAVRVGSRGGWRQIK